MKSVFAWLDSRTGYKKIVHEVLYENVPGGARWRYVWGSTLTFTLVVQFITGIFLWMAYSPSSQTAWESVYYIQHDMTGERIAAEALRLLDDVGERRKMKADLEEVRQKLSSERDPMELAAEYVEQVLMENGISNEVG